MVECFTAKQAVLDLRKSHLPKIRLEVVDNGRNHERDRYVLILKNMSHFQVGYSLSWERIKARADREGNEERKHREVKSQFKHLKKAVIALEVILPAFQHHVQKC